MSIKRIRFVCPKCGKEILSCNYGADLRIDGVPVENMSAPGAFCGDCGQPCIRVDQEAKGVQIPMGGKPGGGRIITP